MANAINVARKFIYLNKQDMESTKLINIKMQLLVYYAFGTHLVEHDEKLFPEKIVAWKYGAKINEVYEKYSINGYSHIDEDESWYRDIALSEKEEKTIIFVWNVLGKLPADLLVEMSRNESVWEEAWNSKEKILYPNKIQDFFERKYITKKESLA